MKSIEIPKDILLPVGPVSFRDFVVMLFDLSPVFGTRAGIRRSVAMEKQFDDAAAGTRVELDETSWGLLKTAAETFGQADPAKPELASPTLHYNPAVGRAAEKAGWFALIENPKTVEAAKPAAKEA